MMSLLSGNVNHVWNTCRGRQVITYSSQESAALPLTLNVHMPLEKGITQETQLEELLRNQQPDYRALDVALTSANRRSWVQRVKRGLTRSRRPLQHAEWKRQKQQMSRRKRLTLVALREVVTHYHVGDSPHHQALEEVEDQICSLVKDELGLAQEHSPR